jgi:hypothetical protein
MWDCAEIIYSSEGAKVKLRLPSLNTLAPASTAAKRSRLLHNLLQKNPTENHVQLEPSL